MTELKGLIEQIPLPWQSSQWQRLVSQQEKGQLAHAYLVAGAVGLGKLAFMQQFARYLLCHKRTKTGPCGRCRDCELSAQANHPDIHLLQPEEGSRDIKVDQIRGLSQFLVRSSHSGGARIAIINHAHHMNVNAANGLLKSLEEPGSNSYIFLLTEAPGMLTATIRSRCQRLQFSVPAFEEASTWLHEHVDSSEDADRLLAAVDNRPLAALELSRTGTLDAEQDFTDKLYALLLGRASLVAVVSAGLKLGESTAITCILKTVTTLSRKMTACDADGSAAELTEVLDKLSSGAREKDAEGIKSLLAKFLAYHQQALNAYRQVSSGANPNPQLVLESLLFDFGNLSSSKIP